nr:MAG TPA: hypothetical protein [Caudoviricetes sp.]
MSHIWDDSLFFHKFLQPPVSIIIERGENLSKIPLHFASH